jgi:cell division protein FtsA
MTSEPFVLALDIGTRTIVGLILATDTKGYRIKAVHIEEHPVRSMFQGQIHDIAAVSQVVCRVKEKLERRVKHPLKRAAVAAAGRTLITVRGVSQQTPVAGQPITAAQVRALELEAVRNAQKKLAEGGAEPAQNSLCVGYSVFHYYLEGHSIANLVGQRGQEISTEVIATFLPRVVIDSLLAVLETAGLEVLSLTLEPIAALNATLSPGMRNLNLALVDIGAGTADIAISRKGTVAAYDMVPRAGDEITESLCSTYLLEFSAGERLKRNLYQEKVEFRDILGNTVNLSATEICSSLKPVVADLAQAIATSILRLNKKTPDGVILIGGGSLTPFLPEMLAQALSLSPHRVGIRTRESLPDIKGYPRRLAGPEAVTSIAIGLWAFTGHPFAYRRVFVNDHPVHLWNLANITVADALLAAGSHWERLYPLPGLALTIEVNGQIKIIKGEIGEPALITVNNNKAGLETPLEEGDRVKFNPPRDGRDAKAHIRDLLNEKELIVTINKQTVPLPPRVFHNGTEITDFTASVNDRARLEILHHWPLKHLLYGRGLTKKDLHTQIFHYTLNGKKNIYQWPKYHLEVNGHPTNLEDSIEHGDIITYWENAPAPILKDVLGKPETSLHITLNKKPFRLPRQVEVSMNGKPVSLDTPLVPYAVIKFNSPKQSQLADIFTCYDPKTQGSGNFLALKVNGQPAQFTTPIKSGDKVDIYWEKNDH